MYLGKRISAIVTAAGSGRRMVGYENKLWIPIGGVPVLERTLETLALSGILDELIIVVSEHTRALVEKELLPKLQAHVSVKLVPGGKERQDSMYQGILALAKDCDWVISQDGARPFLTVDLLTRCLNELEEYKAAVAGVPVKDTVKIAWDSMEVQATPNRKYLYLIQTPQVFHKDVLLRAYAIAEDESIQVTDDASLVEKIGVKVKIVPGSYENIKITTPEDVLMGNLIAKEEIYANRNRL